MVKFQFLSNCWPPKVSKLLQVDKISLHGDIVYGANETVAGAIVILVHDDSRVHCSVIRATLWWKQNVSKYLWKLTWLWLIMHFNSNFIPKLFSFSILLLENLFHKKSEWCILKRMNIIGKDHSYRKMISYIYWRTPHLMNMILESGSENL